MLYGDWSIGPNWDFHLETHPYGSVRQIAFSAALNAESWTSLIEGDEQLDRQWNNYGIMPFMCCIYFFFLLEPIQPSSPITKELHGWVNCSLYWCVFCWVYCCIFRGGSCIFAWMQLSTFASANSADLVWISLKLECSN